MITSNGLEVIGGSDREGRGGLQPLGQVVAVVGVCPEADRAAGWVAYQLAARWTSQGFKVALRPGVRRSSGRRANAGGELPGAALVQWLRQQRRCAHFTLCHLAPAEQWAEARAFRLEVDRVVWVGRQDAARDGPAWLPWTRVHAVELKVLDGDPRVPWSATAQLRFDPTGDPVFSGSLAEALALLACHLVVPVRDGSPGCTPARAERRGEGRA